MNDELATQVHRIVDNIRIAQSTGLYCCVICGELIADWNPDPPRYATHDSCEAEIRRLHPPPDDAT